MAPPAKKTQQSSLDSFFGGKGGGSPSKKKKPKQKKIESFFGANKKETDGNGGGKMLVDSPAPSTAATAGSALAAASKRKTPDTEDSDTETFATTKRNTSSKRRVIQDSDDDEEPEKPTARSKPKKDAHAGNSEKTNKKVVSGKKPTSPAPTAQKTTAAAKLKNEAAADDKDDCEPGKADATQEESSEGQKPKKSKKSAILQAGAKGQFKSDDAVLKEILSTTTTWDKEMPYSVLCQAFCKIEAVTSRLAIQEIMTTTFRQIMLKSNGGDNNSKGDDMETILYLASNSVAAAYECVELGIGDAILIKAIGEATGTSPAMVKQKYETVGDLGSVAMNFKSKIKTLGGVGGFFATTKKTQKNFLTAKEILAAFREIAKTKGSKSQKWKVDIIKKLLVRATDPTETKYIIRGLQGKLRIGLAQSTVLISLAHALALTVPDGVDTVVATVETSDDDDEDSPLPSEAKQYADKMQPVEKRLEAAVSIVKKAYSEVPSYEAILAAALKVPLQKLHKACTLTPGIPVVPMLAKPTKSVQEVLKRLSGLRFTCEYKYDGERAQVHMLADGTTRVFSRNLLDTSEKYPEVPEFVKESAGKNVDSFVLDTEVVAFNQKTGQLVPFQILSTRKKTEESAETAKVQVIVQAFDLMYLNGKSLLNHTLAERRTLLRKQFLPVEGKFQYATFLDHEEDGDTTVLEEFLEAAVKGQCEGLMVKTLDVNAIYEPSRRSLNWLKLKKDYLEGLGDSVDLVPLGAYHGRGKRTGFYGAYLLACYDTEREEFQSVCKIGTGFSDEDLKTLSENLNKHVAPKSSQYNVSDQLECDVWFDPVEVWEVKAADLSKSSTHRGAYEKTGEEGRGIGLRFPRFERLRDDKKPEEATSSDQILEMYYAQDSVNNEVEDDGDDGI